MNIPFVHTYTHTDAYISEPRTAISLINLVKTTERLNREKIDCK